MVVLLEMKQNDHHIVVNFVIAALDPTTSLWSYDSYTHFTGKETKTRDIINLFNLTEEVAEQGLDLRCSDFQICLISSVLMAMLEHIWGEDLALKTCHGQSPQMLEGALTHSPVMGILYYPASICEQVSMLSYGWLKGSWSQLEYLFPALDLGKSWIWDLEWVVWLPDFSSALNPTLSTWLSY